MTKGVASMRKANMLVIIWLQTYTENLGITGFDRIRLLNGASMGKMLYPFKICVKRLSGESLAMAA